MSDRLEDQIAVARQMLKDLDRDLSVAPLMAARLAGGGRGPTPGQELRIQQELGDLHAERERWAARLAVLEAEREQVGGSQGGMGTEQS